MMQKNQAHIETLPLDPWVLGLQMIHAWVLAAVGLEVFG
jgi:hypothetical protein